MTTQHDLVFVLWAPGFDEVAAAVFVTALRAAGQRVKLVSLSRRTAAGSHGLGLVPDMSLEEALPLAASAIGVVIPCSAANVHRLALDPRVRALLWQAQTGAATLVVSRGSDAVLADLDLLPASNGHLVTFSFSDDLMQFATELADALAPAQCRL